MCRRLRPEPGEQAGLRTPLGDGGGLGSPSQECAACGHTAAENRPSQAVSACVACGHTDNADANAARVLKARGIAQLLEGAPAKRKKKTARVRGSNKVGPVRPEPSGPQACSTPVESVSDAMSSTAAHGAVLYEAGNRHLNRVSG